ncbi:MAG TPA: rhomboid family intramembrane serine protease [Candidatus Polarisedimenticolaceae bacterium]|nr:rhomboid family intramembrane serine protease [Candidatus Polarisedimenticolaceae bacterium]
MAGTWVEIARTPDPAHADDLALVLEAAGIPSGRVREGAAHILIVREEDADRAAVQLVKFTAENRARPSPPPAPERALGPARDAAIAYVLVLGAAYLAQRLESYGVDWTAAGDASAGLIRAGAWWRALTALTLHADIVHVAGNALFGALFGVMLGQSVGNGWTWLAFVVAGGLGNAINACVQAPSHVSLGASTGVFGLLGAQVAYEWMRRRQLRHGAWRRAAPVIMGLALLAWLGGAAAAEPHPGDVEILPLPSRIDVGAHLFGFLAGLIIGAVLGARRVLQGRWAQLALGTAAIGLMLAAWVFAVSRGQ